MTMFFGVLVGDVIGLHAEGAPWCFPFLQPKSSGSIWLPMARLRSHLVSIREMQN